jgi:hypothetical protein
MFEVAPSCLYKSSYQRSSDLLCELITEVGPEFISLDEIGAAFLIEDEMSDIAQRDPFLKFCGDVLRYWLVVHKLFFLVLRRAPFLNYVGWRPGGLSMLKVSSFRFRRLSLQFLRPSYIAEILRKTFKGEKTLKDYYQLNDAEIDEVAGELFSQTTGNPRLSDSLLDIFAECDTKEALMKWSVAPEITNYDEFFTALLNFKNQVGRLLQFAETGTSVDLTEMVESPDRLGSIPLEMVANNSFIAWEDEMQSAHLTPSPATREFFATYFVPLHDLL